MSDHIASERSSISVINRDERSLLTTAVQLVVRSFRSQLSSRDAAKHEDGSVRIDTLKAKLPGCTLSERIVCDIYIYDIVSRKNPAKDPKKRIYYFAGGSWQTPPSGQHYRICAKMARDMPDAIVSIVSTPLAPNNPAPGTFPICMKLYRALMAQAEEAGERVILAGDSSGANMILCMTLEALKEDNDHEQADTRQMPHPTAIMAVCPSTDLTRDNPDIQKIAPKDPLLTPDIINHTAKAWHDKWDPADRRVSPINNDISLLSKRGIKVHGITAGCDILSPDGVLFRDRCAKFGVEGEWVHWEKQMHCFILTMQYGLREAEEAVQWMIDILKKEVFCEIFTYLDDWALQIELDRVARSLDYRERKNNSNLIWDPQSVEKRYSGKMVGKVPIVVFATSLKQDVGLLEYDSGSKDATSVVGIEEPVSVIDLEDLSATDTPGCAVLDEASKEGFD